MPQYERRWVLEIQKYPHELTHGGDIKILMCVRPVKPLPEKWKD